MNSSKLRVAGAAALCLVLGIWAGSKVYPTKGIPVPAGVASAPNPSDLTEGPVGGALPGALPAAKIPDRLPQFSLADSAGKPTPIAAFGGKSLIINFWATWCAPCRSEIPLLETLQAEWSGRDMTVIGIAVDYRDKVLDFAKRFKIDYPLLIGEQDALDAAAALGVESPVFPFTVFTDRRGEVVALFIGELHRPQAELILSQVHKLNIGSLQLPAARQAIENGLSALTQQVHGGA